MQQPHATAFRATPIDLGKPAARQFMPLMAPGASGTQQQQRDQHSHSQGLGSYSRPGGGTATAGGVGCFVQRREASSQGQSVPEAAMHADNALGSMPLASAEQAVGTGTTGRSTAGQLHTVPRLQPHGGSMPTPTATAAPGKSRRKLVQTICLPPASYSGQSNAQAAANLNKPGACRPTPANGHVASQQASTIAADLLVRVSAGRGYCFDFMLLHAWSMSDLHNRAARLSTVQTNTS